MSRLLVGLLTLLAPTIACAVPVFPPMDTPTFVAKTSDILIVRCINPDVLGGGKTDGLTLVEVEVLVVIKGDRKTGKARLGTIGQPMEAGKRYLMASFGGDVFDTRFLAQSDQAVVELPTDFDLKSLTGKTAVQQVQAIFEARRAQVERLLQQLQREKKTLDHTVPPPTPKKLGRVTEPTAELRGQLARLDEKYRHGTQEQFAQMEERAESLVKQYTARDDQEARAALAFCMGKCGP